MPAVRKLNPEEIRAVEDKGKGVRKLTEEQYDRAVAGFEVGDYGELTPDRDEKRLTAQGRLRAALSRRGLYVAFLPTRGDAIRFKVEAQARPKRVRRERDYQDEPTPVVASLNAPAPAAKKTGRTKK